ncbi:MAG: hypothetical protein HY865_09720 [Chloroflexi bacterium]|nr:hypothetical protein [Chloroflexota bacterium]
MKRLWFLGLIFGLTACAASATQSKTATIPTSASSLPDLGPAPELTNETWLNVDTPLRLTDLRGKVVAIDMWTFG